MKKITMRRRMISLTLAASVALPQASSVFAASLWDENGVGYKVAQAIESGQPVSEATAMPWVTLPADDKSEQSSSASELVPMETDTSQTTPTDEKSHLSPPDDEGVTTPTDGVDKTSPTDGKVTTAPDYETTSPDKNVAGSGSSSPVEGVAPTTSPTEEILPDDGDGQLGDESHLTGDQILDKETTTIPTTPGSLDVGQESPFEGDGETGLSTGETAGGEEVTNIAISENEVLPEDIGSASAIMPISLDDGPLSQWLYYRLGYGVKIDSSQTKGLTELSSHFAVESTEGGEVDNETGIVPPAYGYRDYGEYLTQDPQIRYFWFGEEDELAAWQPYSLCVFPSGEQLGRVPDKQFEGWYVYPSGAKANQAYASDAMNWYYGDVDEVADEFGVDDMRPVDTMPYGSGDPYFNEVYQNDSDLRYGYTFERLGDTWDGGRDYGYGYVVTRDENGAIEYYPDDSDEIYYPLSLFDPNVNNPVSFVGRWVDSDESRADGIKLSATVNGKETDLTLYGKDFAGNANVDFAAGENGGSYEYWVRVNAEVDSISLDLSTLELYYGDYKGNGNDYDSYQLDTGKSHVTVSATFGGETTAYTDSLSAQMLPKWETRNVGWEICTPKNSIDKPAHSEWSVSGISLRNATNDSLYNDIVVTVKSPSGNETTTYTFHVQRLTEPTLTQAWGNTPVGMIRRDDGHLAKTEDANAAEEYFANNRTFDFDARKYPNGSANQWGVIFRNGYSTNAWLDSTGDIDKDPTAIVVYQDSIFQDPGISLTGTIGETVDMSKGYVTRTLQLKQAKGGLSATLIGSADGGITDCWYVGGKLVDSAASEALSLADGTDAIDLRGLNVLPGIYTLEYQYTDPISGKSYGSDADDYVTDAGKASASAFKRTIVVLPTPGDVDMDGAVTMADAIALENILGTVSAGSTSYTTLNGKYLMDDTGKIIATDPLLTLFAFRVCDMNYDGVLDSKDIEILRNLPNPKTRNEVNHSNSDYFYLPLPPEDKVDHYTRQPLTIVEATNAPALEMVYLGKEGGSVWSEGYTSNPTGPWDVQNAGPVEMGDVFWLGVQLDNATVENLDLEAVKSFTFTLVYDSRYVEPAVVLNEANWNSVVTGSGDETAATLTQKRWERMMSLYNLSATATGHTVWGASPSNYELTSAAGGGHRFTAHYSTAQVPLESAVAETETTRLQSITFSVEIRDRNHPVTLQNGQQYLFALPFKMIQHPFGQETAQLVEFEAGMRSFTLVGTKGDAYAYSTQEEIFGGKTENLRDSISFANAGAQIPLGQDRSEVYRIYNFRYAEGVEDSKSQKNGVYGAEFYSRGVWTEDGEWVAFTPGSVLTGSVPPGLRYNSQVGFFEGVPEAAGTYEFYIGSIPYRLVIDKAPLHYWAGNQSSYYGQPEFRGMGSADFTFRYSTDDIRSFEKERAANSDGSIVVDGDGANLAALLEDSSYKAPTFTAKTAGGEAVTNATPVGNYSIGYEAAPEAQNYEFIYGYPETTTNTMRLTILPRPIQVVHINGTAEKPTVLGTMFNDEGTFLGVKTALQGSDVASDETTFTIRLATSLTDTEGYYNGLLLTPMNGYTDGVVVPGDKLEITFEARCIQTSYDKDHMGSFAFADGNTTEYRDAEISNIRLTGGTGWENYVLTGARPDETVVTNGVVGEIHLRRILSMQISRLDSSVLLQRKYGDSFTRSSEMWLYLELEGGERDGDYSFSSNLESEKGIYAYWATAEEKEAYESQDVDFDYENSDKLPLLAGQVFNSVSAYNGRYVCLVTTTKDNEGNNVVLRCYSDDPLVVTPLTLTLTAASAHRFYGEENGTLSFTYNPGELAYIDSSSHDGLTGAGEELLEVLADTDSVKHQYQAPKLEAVVRAPSSYEEIATLERLTTKTNYTGGDNSVVIWDAKSDNYKFRYTYTSGGKTTTREDYGASVYKIERRPVVVEAITETEPLIEIYADTHRIYSDGQTLRVDQLQLELPVHTSTTATYYRANATDTSSIDWDIGFQEGAAAVVAGDDLYFTYTATVIPTDGLTYAKYVDFAHGYFNMEDVGDKGYKDYPLQITKLRLMGEAADNYVLVYKAPDRGKVEMPNQAKSIREGTFEPGIALPSLYYAAQVLEDGDYRGAVGRVWLRPITDIRLLVSGRTEYTYGETYDPSQGDSNRGGAMTIHIEYLNDERNNWEGNPTIGEVGFRTAGANSSGQTFTTFEARSLKIYYVKANQTPADAIAKDQVIDLNSPLSVEEHDGARLMVVGKRGDQENLVMSQVSTATLKVNRKTLTLTGEDYHRVYGEANPDKFAFTLSGGDLAKWDRDQLGVSTTEKVSGELLSKLGLAYTAPVFGTSATSGSDAQKGYEITNVVNGSLANYTLQYKPGTLYVYPRPVKIRSFNSDTNHPIYTIFSDVSSRKVYTNVTNMEKDDKGQVWEWFELAVTTSGEYRLPDGTRLPVTGDALYVDPKTGQKDEIPLSITVAYPQDLNLDAMASQEDIRVTVENASLMAGTRAANNYVLETVGDNTDKVAAIMNKTAIGRVELRNIENISITSDPTKLEYTYGEALDLSGLVVTIRYTSSAEAGGDKTTNVPYIGPDQFAQYGLYVHYYDSATLDPNDDPSEIGKMFRAAATGDHLTIAPTHDTQINGNRFTAFAANGKYLIITAQRHTDQKTVAMIVPTPIKVNPRPISFTLSAEDKIYDRTTQAAGTITFTNIFNQSGIVDAYNSNGVTDLVYPVIGASYEAAWSSSMGTARKEAFRNFAEYVAQNGYSFTTGSYVPNDPSKPTENEKLDWTAGYKYGTTGTLTFSYLDSNVAYDQTPTHDQYGKLASQAVQVTGLRLAGPDADNYTLVGKKAGQTVEVTTANVATAEGYQGKGLPVATIRKANRTDLTTALLPQVEIDPHTNVVRVNYDQDLSAIFGGEDKDHRDELHFEFALQKVQTGDGLDNGEEAGEGLETREGLTVTDVVQWAGNKGTSTWADSRYFGGETAPKSNDTLTVTAEEPEAKEYVPREEDIPKADSITESTTLKGQVYQWSALDDGFELDLTAYPGGVLWPGYELYKTDREALARDEVYLAVVRAAETNNYNPSRALSSVEGYTPAMIQAILDAQRAMDTSTGADHEAAREAYEEAVQAAAEPLLQAVLDAREAAQDEVDALMAAGESGHRLDERPVRAAAPAVKTYKQVIETVSLKAYQSADPESKGVAYQVPTLEAIWFTDVQELPSKEVLDAVVWNTDPVRYRRYGWDRELTTELDFKAEGSIDLSSSFEVTLNGKGENDGEDWIRVNEDHNARLYVDTTFPSSNGGVKPDLMVIRPGSIMAVIGDVPVDLEVVFYPAWAKVSKVQWESSDPTVATVDNYGQVTFVGIGTAVITATVPGSYPGAPAVCTASITVTVVEDWKPEYPDSIFDFGHLDAFLLPEGDGDKLFLPEARITRGEAAMLLVQFYVENPTWSRTGPQEFTDLTGEEEYAEAAKLLGGLGVMVGYPDGTFGGEQYITRAEFISLLVRMMGLEAPDTTGQTHAFLDTGEEDTWAYSEIDAMSTQPGVLIGVGEGYFAPNRSIVRSEAAAFLTRLLRFPLNQMGDLIIPIDVTEDHWARDPILRAVNGSQILEESFTTDV